MEHYIRSDMSWLSQINIIGSTPPIFKKSFLNHIRLDVANDIAQYSAPALDRATKTYFLLFQYIRLPLIRTQ